MNQPAPTPSVSDPATSDLDRALSCRVCQDAGIVNKPPDDEPPPREPQRPGRRRRPLTLTEPQARLLRLALDHLATTRPGHTPDHRLLALVCLLRGVRTGTANLTSQDMRSLRVDDQHATVAALTGPGWLDTTPDTVLRAEPQHPAACGLPQFTDNPWQVGTTVRPRTSGWAAQVLAHKLLRRQPNGVRLTAVYLTAHARGAAAEFDPQHLVSACGLADAGDLAEAITRLQDRGWLAECSPLDSSTAHARLTPAVATLPLQEAPTAGPPHASGRDHRAKGRTWPELDAARNQTQRGYLMAENRGTEVAHWVHTFRAEHGHGPSWFLVAEAMGWPPRKHRYGRATQNAFAVLGEAGWLAGYGEPYGLRPGPRYPDPRASTPNT